MRSFENYVSLIFLILCFFFMTSITVVLRKKTYYSTKSQLKQIMNQSFLHIYMKNKTTMNLRKLFKQLQQIKTTNKYFFFSLQTLHINL